MRAQELRRMTSGGNGWLIVEPSLPSSTRCSVRANDLAYL